MGIRKKEFNGEQFEILDHDEVPGYSKAFNIIITVAVIYIIYIFSHSY